MIGSLLFVRPTRLLFAVFCACLIWLIMGAGAANALLLASVSGESAGAVTAGSATLSAKINPNGVAASYHVEWGTSTAYGTSVPVPDEAIGSGEAAIGVSQSISGLTADTTYHWRVVAHDANGDSYGPDETFVYDTNGTGLPDGRRYELVTPPEKNGALISGLFARHTGAEFAADGTRVIAPSDQCFAEPESCEAFRLTEGEPYEFERTAGGWVTHTLAPSAASHEMTSYWTADANTGTALFSAPSSADGPDDFLARESSHELVAVGPFGEQKSGTSNLQANASDLAVNGVLSTANLDHVVYESLEPLWSFDNSEKRTVYEYAGTGSVPLMVGVEGARGDQTPISSCETEIAGSTDSGKKTEALSESGRTIYFAPAGLDDNCSSGAPAVTGLYARIDGESADAHTVLISGPAAASCTSPECVTNASKANEATDGRDANFEGATSDGSRVFFTSTQQLTNGASEDPSSSDSAFEGCTATVEVGGCNLYESVCAEPCGLAGEAPLAKERVLVDLSKGAGAGGPRVQGVMAVSADGSHVYFVAKGVLTGTEENANHEKAESEEDNLYLYTEGHVTFIARLSAGDRQGEEWEKNTNLVANVSPDGDMLVFTADRALTADDTREDGTAEAEAAQVYEYDAATRVLKRISVGEDGFDDNGNDGSGNAWIVPAWRGGAFDFTVPVREDPSMSEDGELVFFESPIALVPGALNDVPIGFGHFAENIYEYYGGQVYLISDGKDTTGESYASEAMSEAPTELLGVSSSGANVVFSTFDSLVAEDQDTQRDYYDAHVCSVAEPCVEHGVAPTPCGEGGCQAGAGSPGSPGAPSSETFVGPGNLTGPATVVGPAPLTRAQKLAKALKACKAKKNKHKRAVCEATARKDYGPLKKPKKTKAKAKAKKSSAAGNVGSAERGGE